MIHLVESSNDIRVESWCELCERMYENSWQDDLMRFRSNYAFRGLSDKAYDLKTSFTRRCGAHSHLEYHLLRNFSKYAEVPWTGDNASDWRWLTVAQHHGLPTAIGLAQDAVATDALRCATTQGTTELTHPSLFRQVEPPHESAQGRVGSRRGQGRPGHRDVGDVHVAVGPV